MITPLPDSIRLNQGTPIRQELSFASPDVNPRKIIYLRRYLLKGSVLDVGCGNGIYGLEIASRGDNVLQIDIADRRFPGARHLPFRKMDAQRLDFPNDCFDNVVAFDIMEHLDDDVLFLQEARRVCRGRLILSVPNADDESLRRLSLTHIHHTDKTHRREYTRQGLTDLLVQQGLSIVAVEPQINTMLPYFAYALAKDSIGSKIAARIISLQCRILERYGVFENRCAADWFCVADIKGSQG